MSGDLKTAAKTVLPGLVDKMRGEMKDIVDRHTKKEKVQSFSKVRCGCCCCCIVVLHP